MQDTAKVLAVAVVSLNKLSYWFETCSDACTTLILSSLKLPQRQTLCATRGRASVRGVNHGCHP